MIPYGKHHLDEDDIQSVVQVLRSGALTQGPAVEAFEQAFAKKVGVNYAVAVASGTAALHLSALVAGVGPGKAAVTSPITFVASANAALYAGGIPLFADIDAATINMSPISLRITLEKHPEAKVVIPVHFGGLPCDMSAIRKVADEFGVMVIEDAAHAAGAHFPDGSSVGSCVHSDMTIFSFHPVKAIAAGEGGMITTNDKAIYRQLIRLRSHGINKLDDPLLLPEQGKTNGILNPWYYEMQELGYHYRISDIQCALGLSQLKKLDKFIERRRDLAARYDLAFENLRNLRPAQQDPQLLSGRHLYVIRVNFPALSLSRAELMLALRERGVGSQVHYIPVTSHPLYVAAGHDSRLYPQAAQYYEEALSIPLHFDLNDRQQDEIVAVIVELVG